MTIFRMAKLNGGHVDHKQMVVTQTVSEHLCQVKRPMADVNHEDCLNGVKVTAGQPSEPAAD